MHYWKSTIKKLFLVGAAFIFLLWFNACSNSNDSVIDEKGVLPENVWRENKTTITGRALGTTFILKTGQDSLLTSPAEINQLFDEFNAELSTYLDESLISQLNTKDTVLDLSPTKYFKYCFELSQEIYQQTNGAFDPTVFPLVSLWGFFKDIEKAPEQVEIDSVLEFTGFENGQLYNYENGVINKFDPRFKLVFNAIAKGQLVDVIADFLDSKGQNSYFIEIGGEIRVKGFNDRGTKWVVGIDVPLESNSGIMSKNHQRSLENYIEVMDRAVATSGNYRNFYELDGKKYSHTIDPITGKPVRHGLLSATVVADKAAIADAFATAFMVMGTEKALALVENSPELNLDVYLLFDGEKGRIERAYNRGMLNYLMNK